MNVIYPIIRITPSPIDGLNIADSLTALYADSPDFPTGQAAVDFFTIALTRQACLYLYVKKLRTKPPMLIAAVGCFDDGQHGARRLQHLIVHPDYRGRNLAAKFLKGVVDSQHRQGIHHFIAVDTVIHHILSKYELLG